MLFTKSEVVFQSGP